MVPLLPLKHKPSRATLQHSSIFKVNMEAFGQSVLGEGEGEERVASSVSPAAFARMTVSPSCWVTRILESAVETNTRPSATE